MGQIRIIEKPLPFLPKKCLVTGRADGEIVDMGAESGGRDSQHLYFKRSIIEKAGKVCGMLSETEVNELQEERTKLIAELGEARSENKSSRIQSKAESAAFAYAGAAAASAVIAQHYPDIDLPDVEIIAAAEELVEPTKEEIVNADS
jgi:hypothetical protein